MQTYDFGSGRTDPGSFPTEALAAAAGLAIRELGGELVYYPGRLGHEGLRRAMAERESARESVEVDPEHIALTNGSMQAVTLVAEALLERPGDVIVTEELTYSGTIQAYRGLGARLVGVPLDEEGMRMDALEETLADLRRAGTPPRFIYTLTTYQNPTGAVMPRERRLELLDIARRNDLIVVEDNCYADVHFEGEKQPSLYALDDSPNIVYLCSLSKILGPGVRLGYLMARPPMLERLLARRFDGGNSVLAAAICAELFCDVVWKHLAVTNPILKRKRDAVLAGLAGHPEAFRSWSRPVGGVFIWVELPGGLDSAALAATAEERGVVYAPGSAFHVAGKDIPYLRLAFGSIAEEAISEGIGRLAAAVSAARDRQPVGGLR